MPLPINALWSKVDTTFVEVPLSSTKEELTTLLSYQPGRIGHIIRISEAAERDIIAQ